MKSIKLFNKVKQSKHMKYQFLNIQLIFLFYILQKLIISKQKKSYLPNRVSSTYQEDSQRIPIYKNLQLYHIAIKLFYCDIFIFNLPLAYFTFKLNTNIYNQSSFFQRFLPQKNHMFHLSYGLNNLVFVVILQI